MRKKNMALALLLMLSLNLAGCSKQPVVEVDGGKIVNQGNPLSITEYRGDTATRGLGADGSVEYYICPSIEDCFHNTAGVQVADMTKFKKGYYYTMYLQTYIYLYVPYGDKYIECNAVMSNISVLPAEQVVKLMYEDATNLCLSSEVDAVPFQNTVVVDVSGWGYKVRPTEIVLPGMLRVRADDGSVISTSSVVIQDKPVGKSSSNTYDYYKYNGVVIQVIKGTDISTMLTLL